MGETKIEWADSAWNPVTGCDKISAGCLHCYAARMAKRLAGRCGYPADDPFRVTLHDDRMDEPLRWRQPRTVFVCSMGDLFHGDVPNEYIIDVWGVMRRAKHHRFLVLTKRPQRMYEWFADCGLDDEWKRPSDNIWLGTSVENQQAADERIPWLLKCPAAVRFLSCEPLLGSADLALAIGLAGEEDLRACLDWVIVGGESGPRARPCNIAWIRSIIEQCKAAGVACFMKQLGACCVDNDPVSRCSWPGLTQFHVMSVDHDGRLHDRVMLRDKKGGDPSEWPEDLRVRELPEVSTP